MLRDLSCSIALAALLLAGPAQAQAIDPAQQAQEILTRSVAFRTVKGAGEVPAYAAYLKGVLLEAGFKDADIRIEPMGETAYLTARFAGRNPKLKPIVLLGHMDVVEAKREDWERDPFTPVVEGGYVFGRGALDNKGDVSMLVATLAKLKREGWRPKRDVILALTGDEETDQVTTKRLAKGLRGAELVLNADAGGGQLDAAGQPVVYTLQAAEKTYADYTLTITDPGGHASRPGPSNAIHRMSAALARLAAYRFPVQLSPLTRAYFEAAAPGVGGELGAAMQRFVANPEDADAIATLSANPAYVGQLGTTCVPTQIAGGHAPNALPQRVEVNVNCRIFPGEKVADVTAKLREVLADERVEVRLVLPDTTESTESPLRPDVLAAVRKAVAAQHPGVQLIPAMSPGATDSFWFRAEGVPSYGVAGAFVKPSDDFAHGLNERFPLAAIPGAVAHWETLLRALAG